MRIGIDLGGTKIAGVVLGDDGEPVAKQRRPAPRNDYRATVEAIAEVVALLEKDAGRARSIGIGMPGSISPKTGLAQNGNSTWLNGQPFSRDLEAILGRPVRLANDANCFALSEATDGAGRGIKSVFGVIIGTGCGGGLVHDGHLIDGPHAISGEWGHTPLPWPKPSRISGQRLLVRPRWLHRDVGFRNRARARPPSRHRRNAKRRGNCHCSRWRQFCRTGNTRSPRRSPGAGAVDRHQHLRPRGDRSRRRAIEANAPLQSLARIDRAERLRRSRRRLRVAAKVGRRLRRPWRGLAVGALTAPMANP